MNDENRADRFVDEWTAYLCQRNHSIGHVSSSPPVLRSINQHGYTYRWMLLTSTRASYRIHPAEREHIVDQLRHGERVGDEVFVVTLFTKPQRKVLVLPASEAVGMGRITSEKGGIPWDW